MSDHVKQTLDASDRLRQLRARLDELDAERAKLHEQIEACMDELARATGGADAGSGLSARILAVLRREPTRAFAPMDVGTALRFRSEQDFVNVRVSLSRMSRAGRVRRVGHGRYMSK